MKVAVLGLGNFGYAILAHLDRQGSGLELWGYDKDREDIDFLRENRHPAEHLTEVKVSKRVQFTDDLAVLLKGTEVLVVAIASSALEKVAKLIKPYLEEDVLIVSVMKGFSQDGKASTEVLEKVLKNKIDSRQIAGLAGGMVARELARGKEILGVTIATQTPGVGRQLKEIFQSPQLRVESSEDVIGLEYASGLKNIISILVGMMDGLGYKFGSQTHLISQASEECQRLALAHGARRRTFSTTSQCWGNDMIMSALGETRNRAFGQALGKGKTYAEVLAEFAATNRTVEGTRTVACLPKLEKKLKEYPLLNFIYRLSEGEGEAEALPRILREF